MCVWGASGVKKISRVKWLDVYKPIEKGGLGLKNIELFDLSLLGKWRWRLLVEKEALWYKVIVAKYGEVVMSNPHPSFAGRASLSWFGGRIYV